MAQFMVSAARIPKVLQRAAGRSEEPWRLGTSIYLDGYFQNAEIYRQFSTHEIALQLNILADELQILGADIEACLAHLRLGDFFADRDQARIHALERLLSVPPGSYVMTNDEPLLLDMELSRIMRKRGLSLVSTKDMTAEQVLRTMARYRVIDANDSTLTFWSSVLGGCILPISDPRLRTCRDLLVHSRAFQLSAG